MGHSIQYYEVEVAKGEKGQIYIENVANEDAIREGDYNDELNARIRWIDEVYDNYNSAEKAIEKHDRGWYDQLAVKYKKYKQKEKTKAILALENRFEKYKKELHEAIEKSSVTNRKSKLIGCESCESKISKEYINKNLNLRNFNYQHPMWNACPVCRHDLTPKSTIESLNKKRAKMQETQLAIENAIEANNQKGQYELMWLVKTEFHV